ncbi:response regulator transcription factor [Geodermatophilus sp. DSM 44513]|uniref:LuxR C-terminal-related transcriptional regulator n=1 Tax=Geodermatophilus sp. DSM 44513 TaxID=1528104 RepID=UPI0012702619|nr:response regulator transcription factor [Geodermatophilus sp. DSM 44513]WNV75814.1 response regulator transcription factor [Geodermatophilus sp. DSM 44513]
MSTVPVHRCRLQGDDMDQYLVSTPVRTHHEQRGLEAAVPTPRAARPVPVHPHACRTPTTLVTVLLCEDREVFRIGLRVVLEAEPDMAVVAETTHLPEALEAADGEGSVVVVVRQGLVAGDALPLLRELCDNTAVLVLAEPETDTEPELVEILRAGVRGFLPRRSGAQRLVDGVRALARDEAALDPAATSHLVRHLTAGPQAVSAPALGPLDRLTGRQREVAELVGQGMSNEEIAGRLFLSLATVKSHLTASMRRLDIRSRTELAILVTRESSPAA